MENEKTEIIDEKDKKDNPDNAGYGRNDKGQWVKGVSGNPKGAPKGQRLSLVGLLRKKLEDVPEGQDQISFAQAVIEVLVKKAIKDEDIQAIRDIVNRIDGMPKESVDLTSEGAPVALLQFMKPGDNVDDEVEVIEDEES